MHAFRKARRGLKGGGSAVAGTPIELPLHPVAVTASHPRQVDRPEEDQGEEIRWKEMVLFPGLVSMLIGYRVS